MGKQTITYRQAQVEIGAYELDNSGMLPDFFYPWQTADGRTVFELVGFGLDDDHLHVDHIYVSEKVGRRLNEELGIPFEREIPAPYSRPDYNYED